MGSIPEHSSLDLFQLQQLQKESFKKNLGFNIMGSN